METISRLLTKKIYKKTKREYLKIIDCYQKYLNDEECCKLGINYSLVSVYPWENIKEELFELNKE